MRYFSAEPSLLLIDPQQTTFWCGQSVAVTAVTQLYHTLVLAGFLIFARQHLNHILRVFSDIDMMGLLISNDLYHSIMIMN